MNNLKSPFYLTLVLLMLITDIFAAAGKVIGKSK